MLRLLFVVALLLLQCNALAQQGQTTFDGTWLKEGLDANERAFVSRRGADDDSSRALALTYFVGGVVAAHRQTNLMAGLAAMHLEKRQESKTQRLANACQDAKILRLLAPLAALPESLSPQQVNAVLLRYLQSNPEKWGATAASLVIAALSEAFPVR